MTKQSEIARMFRYAWLDAQLRGEPMFEASASVRLFGSARIREAMEFALGPNMQGRCIRHNAYRDDSVCWEFELLEDAVLFMLMFDGVSGSALNLAHYLETGSSK